MLQGALMAGLIELPVREEKRQVAEVVKRLLRRVLEDEEAVPVPVLVVVAVVAVVRIVREVQTRLQEDLEYQKEKVSDEILKFMSLQVHLFFLVNTPNVSL
ncbi:hypothetical protein SY85_09255 [Flavisolibacter tropicus]|uniref:Uncharacterized protein n=1 Tax=Flavisolibacter tropicus TaxID=1492898 RepID=A0A172TV56_9BACT|nr:hypothetical protein SY85_09255 [Flavisolibacter tropicus]